MTDEIYEFVLAGRWFVNFFDLIVVPVDQIKKIDFEYKEPEVGKSEVTVYVQNSSKCHGFTDEHLDKIKAWMQGLPKP